MQEEISREFVKKIGEEICTALNGAKVDFVAHRESWIIVHDKGQCPRLEKSRYFSFIDRAREWLTDQIDVTCTTAEAERAVQAYIRDTLGMRRYEPGTADPASLLEVWA